MSVWSVWSGLVRSVPIEFPCKYINPISNSYHVNTVVWYFLYVRMTLHGTTTRQNEGDLFTYDTILSSTYIVLLKHDMRLAEDSNTYVILLLIRSAERSPPFLMYIPYNVVKY